MSTRIENLKILTEGIAVVKGTLSLPEITEETNLHDLDLDSLDIVELQMYYEDRMSVMVKDPDAPITTVKQLLDLI
jgi:acyl carrier protein